MYSICILTRPLVFLPGAGVGLSPASAVSSVSLTLERSQSSLFVLGSGKGGREWAKGSEFVGLGVYRFSPSIFEEVDPAGWPAALNFLDWEIVRGGVTLTLACLPLFLGAFF